jgi:hypothetical protein
VSRYGGRGRQVRQSAWRFADVAADYKAQDFVGIAVKKALLTGGRGADVGKPDPAGAKHLRQVDEMYRLRGANQPSMASLALPELESQSRPGEANHGVLGFHSGRLQPVRSGGDPSTQRALHDLYAGSIKPLISSPRRRARRWPRWRRPHRKRGARGVIVLLPGAERAREAPPRIRRPGQACAISPTRPSLAAFAFHLAARLLPHAPRRRGGPSRLHEWGCGAQTATTMRAIKITPRAGPHSRFRLRCCPSCLRSFAAPPRLRRRVGAQ